MKTLEDYITYLDSLSLENALWWFIENSEVNEHKNSLFFYLRNRKAQ